MLLKSPAEGSIHGRFHLVLNPFEFRFQVARLSVAHLVPNQGYRIHPHLRAAELQGRIFFRSVDDVTHSMPSISLTSITPKAVPNPSHA